MRRLTILFFLVTCTFTSFGQTEKTPPSIQVVGVSNKTVKPDNGVLIVEVTHKDMNISGATSGLNNKTKDVVRQITGVGFKEGDIKTTDYQVHVNRIYRRDSYIDSGYVARQNVRVEFKYSKETITKILTQFSKSSTNFEVRFEFKLSDELKKKIQNELITMAVNDAKSKSRTLSESADVKLKRIRDISYGAGYGGGLRESDMMRYKTTMASAQAESIEGFTPNDIELNDSVVITWEIE